MTPLWSLDSIEVSLKIVKRVHIVLCICYPNKSQTNPLRIPQEEHSLLT